MENQNKVYQEVAEECSQYCPCGCDHSVKNVSTGDDAKAPSCLTVNTFLCLSSTVSLICTIRLLQIYNHTYIIFI